MLAGVGWWLPGGGKYCHTRWAQSAAHCDFITGSVDGLARQSLRGHLPRILQNTPGYRKPFNPWEEKLTGLERGGHCN